MSHSQDVAALLDKIIYRLSALAISMTFSAS